jgi:hypothetical protein
MLDNHLTCTYRTTKEKFVRVINSMNMSRKAVQFFAFFSFFSEVCLPRS